MKKDLSQVRAKYLGSLLGVAATTLLIILCQHGLWNTVMFTFFFSVFLPACFFGINFKAAKSGLMSVLWITIASVFSIAFVYDIFIDDKMTIAAANTMIIFPEIVFATIGFFIGFVWNILKSKRKV